MKKILRAIVRFFILIYFKIVYRVKVVGKENIPKDGALIFCGNHRSFLDPPLIIVTAKRHVHFIAKEELKNITFLKPLVALFEIIFVKRDAKDIASLKTSIKYLRNGECIALFPEGTRNGLEKGQKVKNGVSYFALNSDAKVIPVGIKGGEKPFKKAIITYGKPIDFSEERKNKKDKEILEKVTDEIMGKIIELAN
ncbi:MAG: 1-acyl-sn-glycerol-3-phosphate acyltransferase [Clostridia bacterium]|nr:1-acyl-sn-glycerol-3-phosphate acyltransferase [Clostridia bacterium]